MAADSARESARGQARNVAKPWRRPRPPPARAGWTTAREPVDLARVSRPVTILYATVSGRAEQLATRAAAHLAAAGWAATVVNVADYPAARLAAETRVLVFASTWGEGAPPPDAGAFCAALRAPGAPRLPGLRYAVFALGAANYPDFCGCGRRIDADLAARGARRLRPRVECSTRLRPTFTRWLDELPAALARADP